MQLNITTDYAIRTVLFLAEHGAQANSQEISAAVKIPQNYLIILTRRLRQAGLLKTRRGNSGGFALAMKPEDITVFDIVSAMEDTTRLNRCMEDDSYCSRGVADSCKVRKYFSHLQEQLESSMKGMTIAKLMTMES
jgi:Rrf2 family protein